MGDTSRNPTLENGVQALRLRTAQKAAYTGTAGTIANPMDCSIVRVVCTTAAYIKIDVNPTATTNDHYIGPEIPEYFRCRPGDKVSAVQVAASGTLHVSEMD